MLLNLPVCVAQHQWWPDWWGVPTHPAPGQAVGDDDVFGCDRHGGATVLTFTQEDIGDVNAGQILGPGIDARPYGEFER